MIFNNSILALVGEPWGVGEREWGGVGEPRGVETAGGGRGARGCRWGLHTPRGCPTPSNGDVWAASTAVAAYKKETLVYGIFLNSEKKTPDSLH